MPKLIDLGPVKKKAKPLVDLGPAPTPIMQAIEATEPAAKPILGADYESALQKLMMEGPENITPEEAEILSRPSRMAAEAPKRRGLVSPPKMLAAAKKVTTPPPVEPPSQIIAQPLTKTVIAEQQSLEEHNKQMAFIREHPEQIKEVQTKQDNQLIGEYFSSLPEPKSEWHLKQRASRKNMALTLPDKNYWRKTYLAKAKRWKLKDLQKRGLITDQRRQYKGFWDELGRNTVGGSLNVVSGLTGTLASVSEGAIWDKDKLEQWAQRLSDISRKPTYTAAKSGGWRGFVASSVGQALPYMAAATASVIVTGQPYAAFGIGFSVEGDNAYRDALAAGATEEQAQLNRLMVGTINGAIEQIQVSQVFKFAKAGRGSVREVAKLAQQKAMKRIAQKGGKLTITSLHHAARESLEEALQETTNIVAESRINPEVWNNATQRVLQAGIGGGVVGLGFGSAGRILSRAPGAKLGPAEVGIEPIKTPPTVGKLAPRIAQELRKPEIRPEIPPAPITKPKAVEVAPELKPLAQEARKHKTAEQFVAAMKKKQWASDEEAQAINKALGATGYVNLKEKLTDFYNTVAKPAEAKPTEPPKGKLRELGGVPVLPPGLTKAEVEHLGAREQRALRAAQARGYPVGFKTAQREAEYKMAAFKGQLRQKEVDFKKIRDQMFNVVKNTLPTYERGKVNVMALLKSVSSEKSAKSNRKNLMRAMVMTSRYAEQANQRFLRGRILKELAPKKIKPKKKEGLLRGKWTPEIQGRLNQIKAHINDDRAQTRLQIANNIDKYEEGKINYEDMRSGNEQLSMRGIKGMTSAELQNVVDNIKSLKEAGKTIREAQKEREDARIDKIRSRTIEIVTGGKGLKPGAVSVPRGELEARKTPIEKIANWQYGWDNYLDKLSKYDTKSKMYRSDISKFGDAVHQAHNTETTGVDKEIGKLFTEFQKIYKVKTPRQVNKILNGLKQKIDLGTFKNADGTEISLKLSKEQLMKKYQELQDPTLDATFRGGVTEEGKIWGMRWTDEIINAVNESLSPQEKAWADYQMQWYQDYYASVNKVYRELYHVDLPHNLYYSPIGRDIEADIPENVLLAKEGAHYASTITGSLKSRTANALPLRFRGADSTLINHIIRMEHFKAWANTMRDMRRVFGDKKVRNAIRQYHGKDILKQIDEQLNQMARGGIEKAKINRSVDYLRRSFTLSILGVKPVIGLKQIPSVIAYTTEMPFGDFITGVTDFWSNPVKHTHFLRDNSPYFKQRWKAGFERDIRFAMKKGYAKRLASMGNVRDWFMSLIRAGDKFATMQGGWSKYKSALKEGKSQPEAIAAAEQSTKRTQPSFSLESLSPLQRGGSWMKLFTMFQNQPNKYFRIIADNARNMKFGRQTKHKGVANMLVAWVVLPMLFQWIADAFQFKKKHQLRAAVLGPINNLLILGQIAQQIWGWATKEPFDYQASPVFSTGRDLQIAVTKTAKAARDGLNPYKEVNMDDLIKAVEYYGQAAGKLTGVPTPYAVQAERAAREIVEPTKEAAKRRKERLPGWRRHPVAELVFSPWALKAADRVKAMTPAELRKAIEDNTYKRRYKRDGKWYPAGHPYKGREEYVKRLRAELKEKGVSEPKRRQRLEREKRMLRK